MDKNFECKKVYNDICALSNNNNQFNFEALLACIFNLIYLPINTNILFIFIIFIFFKIYYL